MSVIKEFREFALRGNVIDLAVGVVIGAAFGKIVSSLVDDIIMPPIGLLIGGVDFTALKTVLKNGPTPAETVTVNWGNFIQTVISFIIIAFCVFLLVKLMNTLHRKKKVAPVAAETPQDIQLLMEIRDVLKGNRG